MEYQCGLLKTLAERILQKHEFIQVITGPRQVGRNSVDAIFA
jgi:hypothetical protein